MFIGATPTILRPLAVLSSFTPVVVERSGATSSAITVPAGATKALIECIGCGGFGVSSGQGTFGGTGGDYSKRNSVSLSGISSLYVFIDNAGSTGAKSPTSVKANTSGGETLCSASSGANGYSTSSNSYTGDLKFRGGYSTSGGNGGFGGGGAGRTGNGGDASVNNVNLASPGVGNSPGGGGGNNNPSSSGGRGSNYGGGGGGYTNYDEEGNFNGNVVSPGGDGWVSITFS